MFPTFVITTWPNEFGLTAKGLMVRPTVPPKYDIEAISGCIMNEGTKLASWVY